MEYKYPVYALLKYKKLCADFANIINNLHDNSIFTASADDLWIKTAQKAKAMEPIYMQKIMSQFLDYSVNMYNNLSLLEFNSYIRPVFLGIR